MAERTIIKLKQPIDFGDQVIEELAFRPLSGGDLRKLEQREGYNMDVILALAGRLSGQPNAVIDKLTGDDLTEVILLVSSFT